MIVSIILDSLLVALLAVTIYYCFRLNRHLDVIRNSKSELAELIKEFSAATETAEESVSELKNNSKKVIEELAAKIDKGNFIADDLSFLIEKATKVADQLESKVSSVKNQASQVGQQANLKNATTDNKPKVADGAGVAQPPQSKSKAEADLIQALKGMK